MIKKRIVWNAYPELRKQFDNVAEALAAFAAAAGAGGAYQPGYFFGLVQGFVKTPGMPLVYEVGALLRSSYEKALADHLGGRPKEEWKELSYESFQNLPLRISLKEIGEHGMELTWVSTYGTRVILTLQGHDMSLAIWSERKESVEYRAKAAGTQGWHEVMHPMGQTEGENDSPFFAPKIAEKEYFS